MTERELRYVDFPSYLKKYLFKAEERALELITQRLWIRVGLERQIWKDTGVYPSLVGQVLKTMHNHNLCWIGQYKRRPLRIVKQHKNQSVPNGFAEQLKRLSKHLSNSQFHSNVLEVLVSFSLYLIKNAIPQPILIIPDNTISGQQFDAYFTYKNESTGVEVRNKTGDTSLSDADEFIRKCETYIVRPMVISTWITREAQTALGEANGFFCNLSRIYTIEGYPQVPNDFRQNGFDKLVTILDFTRWGWKDATEAKKWLNQRKSSRRQQSEITAKAEEIFLGAYESRALTHLLHKVRGILIYALLSIHKNVLLQAEGDLKKLGYKPYTQKNKQQLYFIPRTYLNMLFHPRTTRSASKIADDMKQATYIKRQNKATRKQFIENVLKFLESFKAVNRHKSSWIVDDAASPYIQSRDIFQ